jgi:hypothetical protein
MGRPLKIAKYDSSNSQLLDTGYPNNGTTDNSFNDSAPGVVGGNQATTGQDSLTIKARVKIGSNAEANGYIVRQKAKHRFLVTDGTNTGVCTLADTNNSSLADDTMTVTVTTADTNTHRLQSLTNKWGVSFAGTKYLLAFNNNGVVAGTAYEEASVNNWC